LAGSKNLSNWHFDAWNQAFLQDYLEMGQEY